MESARHEADPEDEGRGERLTAAIRLEAEVDPTRAAALSTELQQIIEEIGLSGSVKVIRGPRK